MTEDEALVKAEVIVMADFKAKKPELVWECSCGGQMFYLNVDGTIQCRSCRLVRESIEWVYRNA